MSDVMRQIPFGQLMDWVLTEYEQDGSVFGVNRFYRADDDATTGKSLQIFGGNLEVPFGPAAGPHTQLAQNIITSYVSGGRFFELKTVQILDGEDLPVSKPCILAPDECYNVEWSTELYVPQALDEYIKGWFALKLISRELSLGREDGFVFNMSVGYDLEGIKTQKIDNFIEGLKNAENTDAWRTCKEWAYANLSRFKNIDSQYIDEISPNICNSIALSTLHGCPPEEIERIASYLLTEKKLHTFIKCNPTLLGYDYARNTLDNLGFDYMVFDDHHFKADLQFEDAVPMLKRLQILADSLSLTFGVKLTNTFPVKITEGELPGEEMYMSGRALFPLSIEVARKLTEVFDGNLRISYSGGADIHNIDRIFDAGIWPITLATTLLKPGGYSRLHQLAETLSSCNYKPFDGVEPTKVSALAEHARTDTLYRKPIGQPPKRKMKAKVPLLDCFTAPCMDGCPLCQDVPAYLRLAGENKHLEALKVITERNPLPFITGTICSHRCMDKCTRCFYESSVHIRDVKLDAAEKAYGQLMREVEEKSCGQPVQKANSPAKKGEKVAIIGGGPAGLSAAYFLARMGKPVTIFEKRNSLGGIVRHVIPDFRIANKAINNDIALIQAMGVEVRLNTTIDDISKLRKEGYAQIIVATGAWKPGALELEVSASDSSASIGPTSAESAQDVSVSVESVSGRSTSTNSASVGSAKDDSKILGALEFLENIKTNPGAVKLGSSMAVIGGGNTAMDVARAAKRISGVKQVSLVYRRTKRYMPADGEELNLAIEDGVEFCELLAPISHKNNKLTCEQMELGAPDASGRRSPVPTGQTVEIPADTVITAVGDNVDTQMYKQFGIPINERGRAVVNPDTLETNLPGVYIAGDAANGPATVAQAIADAMRCVEAITEQSVENATSLNINPDTQSVYNKKGLLYTNCASIHESKRCLECATVCENCVDVCPNRANISVIVSQPHGQPQIVHIDYMCNECGNCEVFCPYSSAPYKDKFTLFACKEDFENSENQGFIILEGNTIRIRLEGKTSDHTNGTDLPKEIWKLIKATAKKKYMF